MTLYRDEGVVLRTQKLGEADRIVTVLTREHGRVRAVAKGVRRTKSKFGARLEPFSHVDLQCHVGRSLDVVTQVESLAAFGAPIAADYARYTAGTAMLETSERLTDVEREPSLQMYLLLVGGLRSLSAGAHEPDVDARLLPAACTVGVRLRAELRRMRAVRVRRAAPLVLGVDRRIGLSGLSPARFGHGRLEALTLLGALLSGDWDVATPAIRGCGARRAASWRRTCSGTWNAGCVRCAWSSAREPTRLRQPEPAPVRARRLRSSIRHCCRVTSRWSWTGTVAGPSSAGCPAPLGMRPGKRPCSTSSRARSRWASATCRRMRSPPRTGSARRRRCASSWGSTATSSADVATR